MRACSVFISFGSNSDFFNNTYYLYYFLLGNHKACFARRYNLYPSRCGGTARFFFIYGRLSMHFGAYGRLYNRIYSLRIYNILFNKQIRKQKNCLSAQHDYRHHYLLHMRCNAIHADYGMRVGNGTYRLCFAVSHR